MNDNKNIKDILDLINLKEEQPFTPMRDDMEMTPPAIQEPTIPNNIPQEQVFTTPKLEDVLPKREMSNIEAQDQDIAPLLAEATPAKPLSRQEQLLQEYMALSGKGSDELKKARETDRMLKMGGAIGDALATLINARSQSKAKIPGVQVQQGAGLGKVADLFQTAPEISSDLAARREALMNQYKQLALGERSKARMEFEEKRAKERNETMLKAAGIKAGVKGTKPEFTPYQEKMLGEKQEEKVRKLSSEISKSGLPRLTTSIKELENQLGMPLEEALALNTDKDETNDVNIPGYGRLASLAPDWSVGEEQRAFRQGVQAVLNPDISKQYGATQSAGEIERYQKQIGGGNFEDQNAVLRGLAAIKTAAQSDLSAIQAGYDPKLIEKYQERKGVTLDTVKKELTDEEQQALDWANKNPKDPRAIEIKKELKR